MEANMSCSPIKIKLLATTCFQTISNKNLDSVDNSMTFPEIILHQDCRGNGSCAHISENRMWPFRVCLYNRTVLHIALHYRNVLHSTSFLSCTQNTNLQTHGKELHDRNWKALRPQYKKAFKYVLNFKPVLNRSSNRDACLNRGLTAGTIMVSFTTMENSCY